MENTVTSHLSVSSSLTLDAGQLNQNSIIAIDKDGNRIPIIIAPSEKTSDSGTYENSSESVPVIFVEDSTSKGENKETDGADGENYQTIVVEPSENQDLSNIQFSVFKGENNSLVIQIPEESVSQTEAEEHTATISNLVQTEEQECKVELEAMSTTCECDICGEYFTNLKDHLTHHPDIETLYSCDTCGKLFASSDRLTIHLNIHANNVEETLQQNVHVERKGEMNKTGNFPCETCGKTFTMAKYLQAHKNVHLELKRFECTICNKRFTQKRYLKAHELLHKGIKPFKCNECSKCFTNATALKAHYNAHIGVKPYECNLCSKAFYRASNLSAHVKRHINRANKIVGQGPDRKIRCECNLSFVDEIELQIHVAMHTGTEPYKCNYCTMEFRLLCKLQEHAKIHMENAKSFQCQICGRAYGHKNSLRSHLASHAQEKLWKCKICDKRFSLPGNLKTHEKLHTGLKPHKCDICEKTFARIDHMRQHYKIHQGIRPFKCEICNKAFTRSHHYQAHLNNIHNDIKPHECEICNKKFGYISNLRTHQKIHLMARDRDTTKGSSCTGNRCRACSQMMDLIEREDGVLLPKKELQCGECSEYFHCAQSLTIHLNNHKGDIPFRCNFCEKQFTNNKNLNKHLKIHSGARAYSCKLCDKTFIFAHHLKRHMRFHDRLKSLECGICGMGFTTQLKFNEHTKSHLAKILGGESKDLSLDKNEDGEDMSLEKGGNLVIDENKTAKISKHQFTDVISLVPKLEKQDDNDKICVSDSEKLRVSKRKKKKDITEHKQTRLLKSGGKKKDLTKCESCGKKFDSASNVKRHYYAVHVKGSVNKKSKAAKSSKEGESESDSSEKISQSAEVSAKKNLFKGNDSNLNIGDEIEDDPPEGKGSHKCHICSKQFTCLGYLMQHLAKHAGDKPFQCDVCGKGFAMATYLRKHRSSHTASIGTQASPATNGAESSQESASSFVNKKSKIGVGNKSKSKQGMYIAADDTTRMEVDSSINDEQNIADSSTSESQTNTGSLDKQLECDICGFRASGPRYLKQHQAKHSGNKEIVTEFVCDICKKTFSSKWNLKKHQLMHSPKAEDSPKQDKNETSRINNKNSPRHDSKSTRNKNPKVKSESVPEKNHLSSPRGTQPFKCEICGKEFHLPYNFLLHQNKHKSDQDKPYECTICGRHFTRAYNLKKHKELHEKEGKANGKDLANKSLSEKSAGKKKSFKTGSDKVKSGIFKGKDHVHKCEQCGKQFTNALSLKLHRTKHVTNKPFKCDMCSKQFTREYNLLMHKALHERAMMIKKSALKVLESDISRINRKRQVNKCSICGKQFHLAYNLKLHLGTHIKDKPYKCRYCPSAFTREYNLINHQAIHRKIKKEVGAEDETDTSAVAMSEKNILNKSGSGNMDNSRRKQSQSCDNCKCHICGGTFFNAFNLKRHLLIHTKYRKDTIQSKNEPLKKKLKTVGVKKEPQSNSNLEASRGGKNVYLCDICGKSFTNAKKLRVHRPKHFVAKPYKCEFCPKLFSKPHYLKFHLPMCNGLNTENPKITVTSMPKSPSGSSDFDSEEKIIYVNVTPKTQNASSDKKSKKVFQSSKLDVTSSSDKIYQCHICQKQLSRAYNLKKHLERHKELEAKSVSDLDQSSENLEETEENNVGNMNIDQQENTPIPDSSELSDDGSLNTRTDKKTDSNSVDNEECDSNIDQSSKSNLEGSVVTVTEDGTGKECFTVHLVDLFSDTATETYPQNSKAQRATSEYNGEPLVELTSSGKIQNNDLDTMDSVDNKVNDTPPNLDVEENRSNTSSDVDISQNSGEAVKIITNPQTDMFLNVTTADDESPGTSSSSQVDHPYLGFHDYIG